MGDLLINVVKAYGGETWENTHCLRMNAAGGTVTDADMTALGVGTAITAANTASGGAVNPLTRILSFERQLHRAAITITGVYVTDGVRNFAQTPDYFWSASLSLTGTQASPADLGTLAPGTIALVVNRIPTGFGSRSGRLFVRGLLVDDDTRFNMRGGVDWTNATQSAAYATVIANAITGSGLNTMFQGGANAAVATYCIPHYLSKKVAIATGTPLLAGQLMGATPVASVSSGAPRSRQMLRGKKRKAATSGTAV